MSEETMETLNLRNQLKLLSTANRSICPSNESVNDICNQLSNCPSMTNVVDLSLCYLGSLDSEISIRIFNTIPPQITQLSLVRNLFFWFEQQKKTLVELATLFSALPLTLVSLDLRQNFLDRKEDHVLAFILAVVLPIHIQTVLLEGREIQMDSFLEAQVKLHITEYRTIQLPTQLDESSLNQIISMLEERNKGILLVIGGLLIESYMTLFSETSDDADLNRETQTLRAIALYEKAYLEDESAHASAEFLLWHHKTTSKLIAVQEKLEAYTNLTPSTEYVPTFFQFDTPTPDNTSSHEPEKTNLSFH